MSDYVSPNARTITVVIVTKASDVDTIVEDVRERYGRSMGNTVHTEWRIAVPEDLPPVLPYGDGQPTG